MTDEELTKLMNEINDSIKKNRLTEAKAKYIEVLCYPENMVDDWEDVLETMGKPMSYGLHDQCETKKHEKRKEHVHVLAVWSEKGTTTLATVFRTFNRKLSKNGNLVCLPPQEIIDIRRAYDYLIHDTDDCRRKGKYLYDPSVRKCINNFDIGAYEQLDKTTKDKILLELIEYTRFNCIAYFDDVLDYAVKTYGANGSEVVKSYHGLLEHVTHSVYHKICNVGDETFNERRAMLLTKIREDNEAKFTEEN